MELGVKNLLDDAKDMLFLILWGLRSLTCIFPHTFSILLSVDDYLSLHIYGLFIYNFSMLLAIVCSGPTWFVFQLRFSKWDWFLCVSDSWERHLTDPAQFRCLITQSLWLRVSVKWDKRECPGPSLQQQQKSGLGLWGTPQNISGSRQRMLGMLVENEGCWGNPGTPVSTTHWWWQSRADKPHQSQHWSLCKVAILHFQMHTHDIH